MSLNFLHKESCASKVVQFLLQRAFSLLPDSAFRLEELSPAQSESEQVLREDREADDERQPTEGLPLGDEPGQDHQDG